jgi:chorismate--pyruvate lyase
MSTDTMAFAGCSALFLDLDWQPPEAASACPPSLRDLLTEQGSLTARLRALCADTFSVRVLNETRRPLSAGEAARLEVEPGARGFVREVQLCCADLPLVFACTLAPAAELDGRDQWLAQLGHRALGDYVFGTAGGGRGPLEVARIAPTAPLVRYAMQGAAVSGQALWARRSRLQAQALAFEVMECFLPGVDQCIHASRKN